MSQPLNVKYLVTTSDRPKSDSHRNQNLIIGICEINVGPMKFCLIFKNFIIFCYIDQVLRYIRTEISTVTENFTN